MFQPQPDSSLSVGLCSSMYSVTSDVKQFICLSDQVLVISDIAVCLPQGCWNCRRNPEWRLLKGGSISAQCPTCNIIRCHRCGLTALTLEGLAWQHEITTRAGAVGACGESELRFRESIFSERMVNQHEVQRTFQLWSSRPLLYIAEDRRNFEAAVLNASLDRPLSYQFENSLQLAEYEAEEDVPLSRFMVGPHPASASANSLAVVTNLPPAESLDTAPPSPEWLPASSHPAMQSFGDNNQSAPAVLTPLGGHHWTMSNAPDSMALNGTRSNTAPSESVYEDAPADHGNVPPPNNTSPEPANSIPSIGDAAFDLGGSIVLITAPVSDIEEPQQAVATSSDDPEVLEVDKNLTGERPTLHAPRPDHPPGMLSRISRRIRRSVSGESIGDNGNTRPSSRNHGFVGLFRRRSSVNSSINLGESPDGVQAPRATPSNSGFLSRVRRSMSGCTTPDIMGDFRDGTQERPPTPAPRPVNRLTRVRRRLSRTISNGETTNDVEDPLPDEEERQIPPTTPDDGFVVRLRRGLSDSFFRRTD